MGFAIIALFVVIVAAGAAISYHLKQKRRRELALVARQLGLEYSTEDLIGCLGYPFRLLTLGDGRGTENVLSGVWQDLPLVEFDYWYYEESTDSKGNRSRTYYHFSCAVTGVELAAPHLTLERENLLTRLADHLALHDIEFESEDFNRAFNVKSPDPKFANDLVDARMMQWMLTVDRAFEFEVCDSQVLCYSKRRSSMELVPLLGTLKAFRDHIPRVVYDLYAPGGTG